MKKTLTQLPLSAFAVAGGSQLELLGYLDFESFRIVPRRLFVDTDTAEGVTVDAVMVDHEPLIAAPIPAATYISDIVPLWRPALGTILRVRITAGYEGWRYLDIRMGAEFEAAPDGDGLLRERVSLDDLAETFAGGTVIAERMRERWECLNQ